MFYEEIRTKQGLSYISLCSLSILYNSKFILMTTYSGRNVIVVTRVHCIIKVISQIGIQLNIFLNFSTKKLCSGTVSTH